MLLDITLMQIIFCFNVPNLLEVVFSQELNLHEKCILIQSSVRTNHEVLIGRFHLDYLLLIILTKYFTYTTNSCFKSQSIWFYNYIIF